MAHMMEASILLGPSKTAYPLIFANLEWALTLPLFNIVEEVIANPFLSCSTKDSNVDLSTGFYLAYFENGYIARAFARTFAYVARFARFLHSIAHIARTFLFRTLKNLLAYQVRKLNEILL